MRPEILAPAGSMEAVFAAVRCGADAVYLGGVQFNARRNADNFTREQLAEAVRYCHERNVRVYLALNTLVTDGELPIASEEIKCACTVGVDALILQDLGLVSLCRKAAPDMPLHASTQMSVHTPEGAQLLESLGFKRAVLARELSKEETQEILRSTSMEIELFVHGALCMCVSGQCYTSALLGRRSGNRGLCAQTCRLPFQNGTSGHALSLKDLSLIKHAQDMQAMGIASLKIEGRMKRPEYVAAAVTACKHALDGELTEEESQRLQQIFSRTGFTDGYWTGRRGKEMFGYRRKEDVAGADAKTLKAIQSLYHKERGRIPCRFRLELRAETLPGLTVSALGLEYTVNGSEIPEPAITNALTAETLTARLQKCGGTPFYAESIEIHLDDGLAIPASAINALRRNALDGLTGKLAQHRPTPFQQPDLQYQTVTMDKPKLYVRYASEQQLPGLLPDTVHSVILPAEMPDVVFLSMIEQGKRVIAEVPRGLFGTSGQIEARLKALKAIGVSTAAAGTWDAVQTAKNAGMELLGFIGTNLMNTEAIRQAGQLGMSQTLLSFEMTLHQMQQLKPELPIGAVCYGHLPQMLTRNCPLQTCKGCPGSGTLTDRKGIEIPVACTNGCSELFNPQPLYLLDRLRELPNLAFHLLYFTQEPAEACNAIIHTYQTGAAFHGSFTRGLYDRGVE